MRSQIPSVTEQQVRLDQNKNPNTQICEQK